jgi:cellulose synthase/poly-beta-1,6-N-acetylglucosamine synthase-like glycosyltransferase
MPKTLDPATAHAIRVAPAPSPAPARTPYQDGKLTVVVPAYNEAASIADTIRSLQNQTRPIDEIVIIDDFSSDNTGEIARSLGVTVIRPPKNTGSKAGAQNFALGDVTSEFTMAIDADTTLAPDAIELIMAALDDPQVVAACGFVVPRYVHTVWERGRYVEYLLSFTFYKPIQDYFEKPLIASGCFSVYRTKILKAHGGWNTRTVTEDMDLTWSFYEAGHKVRFMPEAVSYPIEPHGLDFMSKQLKRWSHGWVQNVMLHWRGILRIPFLRNTVAIAMWDAIFGSFACFILLPFLTIFVNPLFILGYFLDVVGIAPPVLYQGWKRGEFWRALASLPSFCVLRLVNATFTVRALVNELVLKRPLKVYEKGH